MSEPEWITRQNQTWRASNPKGYMLARARRRARDAGLPCTITTDDFEIPERCPVFPEIVLVFGTGRQRRPDCTPALDRLIPELGYVPGNVRVISMRANRLKSDATPAELRRIADWVESEIGKR